MTAANAAGDRRRPPLLPGLLVLALIVAGGVLTAFVAHGGLGAPAKEPTPPISVNVRTVSLDASYALERRFVGRVEARRRAHVGFELAGTITHVVADEGDRVAAGDRLATLDTARLRAERARLAAARDDAVAGAGFLRRQFDRRAAAGPPAFSEAVVDEARTAMQQADAQVARIDAEIEGVEVDLAKSVLRAPFDAVVSARHVDEGDVVPPGSTALVLLDAAPPEARVGLAGPAQRQLEIGQRRNVWIDGTEVAATVAAIVPTRDLAARTVDAILRLETSWQAVNEGDLVHLQIEETVAAEGAWLPLAALTESARGLFAVYVAEPTPNDGDRRSVRYEVEVLHEDGDRAFVRGVPDGAAVVVTGVHKLAPEMPVRIAAAAAEPAQAARR